MNDRHVCGGQSYLLINIYPYWNLSQLSRNTVKSRNGWSFFVRCILHLNENDDTQYVSLDLSAHLDAKLNEKKSDKEMKYLNCM